MRQNAFLLVLLLGCLLLPFKSHAQVLAGADFAAQLQAIRTNLELAPDKVNFASVKLAIDEMIDPGAESSKTLQAIDSIVTEIQTMVKPGATSMDKVLAIKKFLYQKGPWNNDTPYQYDFSDPMGTRIASKITHQYISTKKGNCISMPLLFIILAQKMGLDVAAAVAPLHVFVKFTESETGKTYSIEATSGGNFARDEWYRSQMPMTDQAIENGLYLRKLSKTETASVMVTLLGEFYFQQKEFEKAAEVFEQVLRYYPKSEYAMIKAGSSYYGLLERDFLRKYRTLKMIPAGERERFQFYVTRNRNLFEQAESLGWREPPKGLDEQYVKGTQDAAKR